MTESDITICGHGSGVPTKKNMREYFSQRYNSKAPNGKHKGIVAVRRLKGLTDAKRKEFVSAYKTILGRNVYSQDRRGYVFNKYSDGRFYSDCSSSGMACFKKIGFKFKWLYNTAAIYQESEFESVPVKIKDGHITNPEVLKVGDCLLFVGNDPSRPKQIGHVEYVFSIPTTEKKNDSKAKVIAKPTVKMGSKGYEVKVLQGNLNEVFKGKYTPLVVDGIAGVKTVGMIEKFQKKYKLEIDGIYGPISAAKMTSVIKS